MTFTLTPEQRAACDAFEKTCRELCVGPVDSVQGGFIARKTNIVIAHASDRVRSYAPNNYKVGLADRIEISLEKLYADQVNSEARKARRLAEIEAEAKRLRAEIGECVA